MKITIRLLGLITILTGALPPAAQAVPPDVRVGTYDSRLVAFAAFWSDEYQARLKALKDEARSAKARGDTTRYQAIVKEITAGQSALHLQVFSTAPIDDVLAGLGERLPAIRRELGVDRLASQWDEDALAGVAAANRVDVTDRLINEFHLSPARREQVEKLKTAKPVPLWRARLMNSLHLL
jgi:hypothetical protein